MVLIYPLLGHMERPVGRSRSEIEEERLIRSSALLVGDIVDSLVCKALDNDLTGLIVRNPVGIAVQNRMPLILSSGSRIETEIVVKSP